MTQCAILGNGEIKTPLPFKKYVVLTYPGYEDQRKGFIKELKAEDNNVVLGNKFGSIDEFT